MTTKILLKYINIAFSLDSKNAFLLILQAENTNKSIPIIIGKSEAQNINILGEKLKSPQQFTYQFFDTILKSFQIEVKEVHLFYIDEGIFGAQAILFDHNNSERHHTIDCRCSDAVALALQNNVPIYTTPKDLQKFKTFDFSFEDAETLNLKKDLNKEDTTPKNVIQKYEDLDIEKLQIILKRLIDDENYLEAAKIRDLIQSKKK
ncbi:MAG: bifunctional nuclease family protein [Alphaproteobacteria bacterium]|nr:bifunctional nuclease family protein [Alphaproteobacteria bacterium]